MSGLSSLAPACRAGDHNGSLPSRNPAATTSTAAKLLWDREYLYFFVEPTDGDLYADIKDRDDLTWDNDVFELFFKPQAEKPGYYEFQVTPAGTVLDMAAAVRRRRRLCLENESRTPRHAEQMVGQGRRLVGRRAVSV